MGENWKSDNTRDADTNGPGPGQHQVNVVTGSCPRDPYKLPSMKIPKSANFFDLGR